MAEVTLKIIQISDSAAEGKVRGHSAFIDRPEAKGGVDKGPMGGEFFLMGLGGCFMSNLLAAVKAREADVSNVRIEVTGTIEDSPMRFTAAQLAITADFQDRTLMNKLVTIAERGCLVANTVKNTLDLSIVVN